MELFKNILKYLLILVAIFILGCSLIAGILFVFPKATIFGFRYTANKEENVEIISDATVTKVNISTSNYDIRLIPNSQQNLETNKNLRIVIKNSYMGFTNNKVVETQLKSGDSEEKTIAVSEIDRTENKEVYYKDGILNLNLVEPKGVISFNNSQIIVYLPENAENVEYNLSTEKGKITFEKSEINEGKLISTSNINISVKNIRGSFSLDNAKMSNGSVLKIQNYLGRVNINSDYISNVEISSNSGNFNFKNIGYDGLDGDLVVSGNNPYVRANSITGNVKFETTTGFIETEEIKKDAVITTKNGIVRLSKILGGLELRNDSGETAIGQIGDGITKKSVKIYGKSGLISLGGDESKIVYNLNSLTTETGKVIIKNLAETNVEEISSTKGSINIEFVNNDKQKSSKVKSSSGNIEIKNINGQVDCETSKGTINATFIKYFGESNFKTNSSNIQLQLTSPTDDASKQVELNAKNKENKLSVNVGAYSKNKFDGAKDGEGYYNFVQKFPIDCETANKINIVTNSGKIIVKENV